MSAVTLNVGPQQKNISPENFKNKIKYRNGIVKQITSETVIGQSAIKNEKYTRKEFDFPLKFYGVKLRQIKHKKQKIQLQGFFSA